MVVFNLRGLDAHSTAALILGNCLLLVQTFAIGLIVILQKRVLRTYPACTVAAWSYGLGAVVSCVGAVSYYGFHSPVWLLQGDGKDGYWAWAALVYAILVPTMCAHSLSTWANTQLVNHSPLSYSVVCMSHRFVVLWCAAAVSTLHIFHDSAVCHHTLGSALFGRHESDAGHSVRRLFDCVWAAAHRHSSRGRSAGLLLLLAAERRRRRRLGAAQVCSVQCPAHHTTKGTNLTLLL